MDEDFMGHVLGVDQQEVEEHEISEEDLEGTPEHTPPQEAEVDEEEFHDADEEEGASGPAKSTLKFGPWGSSFRKELKEVLAEVEIETGSHKLRPVEQFGVKKRTPTSVCVGCARIIEARLCGREDPEFDFSGHDEDAKELVRLMAGRFKVSSRNPKPPSKKKRPASTAASAGELPGTPKEKHARPLAPVISPEVALPTAGKGAGAAAAGGTAGPSAAAGHAASVSQFGGDADTAMLGVQQGPGLLDADTLALLTEKTRQAKDAQKAAAAAEERITALLLEQSAQDAALGEAQRTLSALGGQLPVAIPPAAAAYEGGLEEAKGRLGELRGQLAASETFLQRAAALKASSGAGSMEVVVAQLRLAAQRPAAAAPTAEAAAAAVAAAVQGAAGRGEAGKVGAAAAAGAQGAAEGAEGGQEAEGEEEEEGAGGGTTEGQETAPGGPGAAAGPGADTVAQCEAALGALRELRAAAEAAVAAGALPALSGLAGRLGEEVAEARLRGEALEREIEALQVVVMHLPLLQKKRQAEAAERQAERRLREIAAELEATRSAWRRSSADFAQLSALCNHIRSG